MGLFAPRSDAEVAQFVRTEMLGLVTTHDEQGFVTTPLPLLAELDDTGRVHTFIGHFALANPHVARAQMSPRAQIAFLGAHGYISPTVVSAPGWGPTWNYRFVQFGVDLQFEPERNREAIVELVGALEGTDEHAWTVEQMGARFEGMAKRVVAFRAVVVSQTAQFKLGQDENPETFLEIVKAQGSSPLAEAMIAQRQ